MRQERRREHAVVGGSEDEAVGPVGHQPSDPAEVAGRGVPTRHHDLELAGHLLDLLEDVRGEQHRAALGAHVRSSSISWIRCRGSIPLKGSSSSSTDGSWTNAEAILTRCRMPFGVRRVRAVLGVGHLDQRGGSLGRPAGSEGREVRRWRRRIRVR